MEDGGWKMEDGRWKMEDGGWRMEDGGWKMEDGRWRMEDGGWKMEDGRWRMEDRRSNPIESSILSFHSPSSILHPRFLCFFLGALGVLAVQTAISLERTDGPPRHQERTR